MTKERWSQIGITTEFLIVVRTLGEVFRLRHVHGTNFSTAVAALYVGGALIAACSAEVYTKFTPLQKQMVQEMLDTMHPMTERYPGTTNDGEMIQREAVSTNNVSAPTLILHAKDDALVSYHHAEHAHEAIKHSRLISFDTGGHGLLPQMNAVRQDVKEFLERL